MMDYISIIKLSKDNCYAIISPNKITYVLEASKQDLEQVKFEVLEEMQNFQTEPGCSINKESLSIIPTFDCNLQCIYCYANAGKTKEIINIDVVKRSLEFLKSRNGGAKHLDLYLVGGGEPLLYFKNVKNIVKYADLQYDSVKIHVVTNGTFNEEVLMWLVQRDANIRISYDVVGQRKQRPFLNGMDSSDDVIGNITRLVRLGNTPMIQCIITSETVDRMKEIVDIVANLGIDVIKLEPCLMTDVSRGSRSLQPDPIVFANHLLEVIEYVADKNLPIKVDTGYFSRPSTGKYCGMGDGNFIVTPEGMITACVEVARKRDPYAEKIFIGEINDGVKIYDSNVRFLNSLHYSNQLGGCNECDLRLICLGGCPMANIWENGFPVRKSQYTCIIEHEFLPKLLLMILNNKRIMDVVMENAERF